jgi:hypothetical protein
MVSFYGAGCQQSDPALLNERRRWLSQRRSSRAGRARQHDAVQADRHVSTMRGTLHIVRENALLADVCSPSSAAVGADPSRIVVQPLACTGMRSQRAKQLPSPSSVYQRTLSLYAVCTVENSRPVSIPGGRQSRVEAGQATRRCRRVVVRARPAS